MAKEFEDGNHGEAAVVELLVGEFLELLRGLLGSTSVTELEEAVVVSGSDGEDHLHPSKGRDGVDGGNAGGDGGAGKASGKVEGELVGLSGDVAKDGKHGNTAVLDLGSAVLLEVIGSGQVEGIEEAKGASDSSLIGEGHLQGRAAGNSGRGEGRG